MKKTAITIAALVAATLLMSCSDGGSSGSGDDSENQNPSAGGGTTATAKFDLNLPDNTNLEYGYSNNEKISDITKEKGTAITLPSTACYYSKWSGETFICNYKFSSWNTEADGSGSSYNAGASFTLNENITFYAQYKASSSDGSGNDDSESGSFLDVATTTQYSMKVGETVWLKASWAEECSYSIYENEDDAISLNNGTITAETIGTATVKITSSTNSSKAGYCIITVTSDSFSGTGLDYKMIGKWTDGDSYIQLNSDYSGYMKVYLNSSVVQDVSFNWATRTEGSTKKYKYLKISNATDYLNKDFTIISVSSTTLKLKGYLAFGKPEETSWTKEN